MPRYPNSPTACEGTQRLELAYLRKIGLLQPGVHRRTLHWSNQGQPGGSISIDAHIKPGEETYLRLHYTVNGTQHHDYRVPLETVDSNLPGVVGGYRYYLVCPPTGRHATVLYLRSGTGVFAHRSAFAGERLYYDSQLENKWFRGLSNYFGVDRAWEAQMRKGRKRYYRGQPTKWHERLLKLEQKTEAAAPALLRMLNGY